jgi:hypothetical protein
VLPEHLLADRHRGRFLRARHNVSVRRESEAGVRVAQTLRHRAERDGTGEQEARVQVAEIVGAQAPQLGERSGRVAASAAASCYGWQA